MWDDYKNLPETQFFIHYWWAHLLLIAAFVIVAIGVNHATRR